MNTVYAVQSACLHDKEDGQRGAVSVVLLSLLFVMVFLGRGLIRFAQQEAEHVSQYRLEMELHLAAEEAMEGCWRRLGEHASQMEDLQEGDRLNLEQGNVGKIETYTYAIVRGKKLYLVSTAFCRSSDWEKKVEPHVMLKAEIRKGKEENGNVYFRWLGWTA